MQKKHITIIGGGPAALMLAAELDTEKYEVTLCEKKKTVGRKFLVAGEGGLNLTYHAPLEELIQQYFPGAFMDPIIRRFTNEDWISWLHALGITTFSGSSNRVFPEKEWKPIDVLNAIVTRIRKRGVHIRTDTQWLGWKEQGQLLFEGWEETETDIVVFALGGASWKVTGTDGGWRKEFLERGIDVRPFQAANCGFAVAWTQEFLSAHEGKPLKNIALRYRGQVAKGELVISKLGLEGNAIYALSRLLQEGLQSESQVVIHLDLKPTMSHEQVQQKLRNSLLTKVTDILKKDLNLDSTAIAIVKQCTDKDTFLNPTLLAAAIKSVPIVIHGADELDKAISTLGGIALDEIDAHFQLKKIPGTYAIGEMLDWYAPTGGYLLQGCFSMGWALAQHLNTQ
ncbi:MAG TPA: aminoacetone oxidase family FAD-binding enzyme [Bacteroidetes bacterium]|jgi:uncharacterized flavoprotein (TIGR03862 family)|nr:aminoacetone oxidase family FAD-binding enzyme [Bacteroidota bacterium]